MQNLPNEGIFTIDFLILKIEKNKDFDKFSAKLEQNWLYFMFKFFSQRQFNSK